MRPYWKAGSWLYCVRENILLGDGHEKLWHPNGCMVLKRNEEVWSVFRIRRIAEIDTFLYAGQSPEGGIFE